MTGLFPSKAEMCRLTALEYAKSVVHITGRKTAGEIIEDAKTFERYLSGADDSSSKT